MTEAWSGWQVRAQTDRVIRQTAPGRKLCLLSIALLQFVLSRFRCQKRMPTRPSVGLRQPTTPS